jgi:uncharacterized iron-regulated membrane protein
MSSNPNLLRSLRQIHLYFGVLIAPSLIFFAFTGALQTFNLHESGKRSDYQPPRWVVTLSQIHKNQRATAPPRKPERPAPAMSQPATPIPQAVNRPPKQEAAPNNPLARKHNPLPLKIFFLLVCVGLFTSTFTGIYMAYKYSRGPVLVTALLLAGMIIPVLLLFA